MAVFQFSLQSVLNHRIETEEERKNMYQQAIQILNEEKEKVQQILKKIAELNESLEISGIINITTLQQLNLYQEQLRRQLSFQQEIQSKSEKQVELAQNQLLKAKMDVQIMEKLKEKQLEAYRQEERAEENNLLDELACIKYKRP